MHVRANETVSPRRTAAIALAVVAVLSITGVVWSQVAPSHPNGPIAFVGKGLRADDRDLFLLDPTTGATRNLTQTPKTYEGSPAWSPDGSKVVFDRYTFQQIREGEFREIDHLVLMDLATGDQADPGWCESASCAHDVAWSPDGTHVALFDVVGGERVLRSIDVASGTGIDLCTQAVCGDGLGRPIWSPDGRWVAVSNVLRTRSIGPVPISGSVWVARSDGSSVQRMTPEDPSACPAESSNEGCPFDVAGSFSPDSTEVAFSRYDFSREDRQPTGTFIVSVTTGAIRPLSPCEPDYCPQTVGPSWSPDGRWITGVAGSGELALDAATGTASRTLDVCSDPRCDGLEAPVWSPDGSWLAVVDDSSTQLHVIRVDGSDLSSFDLQTESYEPIAWLPPSDLLTVP
ncbi:MAG: hypothetical protein ABI572_01140 [Actinomycetota bacterium]